MIGLKKIFLLVLIILSGVSLYPQDPHYSQYYANPLYLNPAFAGTAICPRLIMNYRNQWPSIAGNYVTYNASYDQHVENLAGGVGLMFTSDQAGESTLNTTIISGIYSYRLQVSRYFSIKAGFQATYFQKSLDWEKLTFGDQIDPRYGFVYFTNETKPSELTKGTVDFSAGILGYSESVYGGVAVNHLTEPNEGFFSVSKLPMRITVHAGGVIDLEHHRRRRKIEDPTISPNILFMKQLDFEEINYGLYYNKYPLVGGLWFRQGFDNPDAFIALIGLQTSVVKIGYSYDVTVSKLSSASGGAHEVSFALQFDCRPKKKRIRAINCPSF
ncbi:MAG TPA: type IX secretion system membrane protein PorP/SprF [Bacteroidales bacterium]|nr:type IX secretion system membrane protein PorP/SprF [Bacteroidales bacterium]HPS16967.1 type IX secretion system membrane protein PorP/SprF [Bacteroidales bacterium]